uniref:Uncharacterized protein n=1 Tax=Oryza glumipatula TaxID=40148 RepID=A0A0D9Y7I1_9ORYZ
MQPGDRGASCPGHCKRDRPAREAMGCRREHASWDAMRWGSKEWMRDLEILDGAILRFLTVWAAGEGERMRCGRGCDAVQMVDRSIEIQRP